MAVAVVVAACPVAVGSTEPVVSGVACPVALGASELAEQMVVDRFHIPVAVVASEMAAAVVLQESRSPVAGAVVLSMAVDRGRLSAAHNDPVQAVLVLALEQDDQILATMGPDWHQVLATDYQTMETVALNHYLIGGILGAIPGGTPPALGPAGCPPL